MGYETVRYPLSGLVGTSEQQKKTDAHNKDYPDYETNVCVLNQNISNWLLGTITIEKRSVKGQGRPDYRASLDAPNYTVFSNRTSSGQWNKETKRRPSYR